MVLDQVIGLSTMLSMQLMARLPKDRTVASMTDFILPYMFAYASCIHKFFPMFGDEHISAGENCNENSPLSKVSPGS